MADIFEGYGATVTVADDIVSIKRKGAMAFSLHGLKGEKRIPFSSIAAVQFKPSGVLTSGYIQFSVIGGNEGRGGLIEATKDENSVIFKGKKQTAEFERLRKLVEDGARRSKMPVSQVAAMSKADELAKLADLLDRGLLTRPEFDQQKAILFGH